MSNLVFLLLLQDFLTEFYFAKSVLSQIWSELVQLNVSQTTSEESNNNKSDSQNEFSNKEVTSNISKQLEPLNHTWHQTIEDEIMERIRDLQREHHKRSLAHLLNSNASNGTNGTAPSTQNPQSPPAVPPKPKPKSLGNNGVALSSQQQNVYDTVADALNDGPAPTPSYHRPFENDHSSPSSPSTNNNVASSANLDLQRQEVESWLTSMEKRFGDFVAEYNHTLLQSRKSSLTGKDDSSGHLNLTTEASLKKQLTIISVSFCFVLIFLFTYQYIFLELSIRTKSVQWHVKFTEQLS